MGASELRWDYATGLRGSKDDAARTAESYLTPVRLGASTEVVVDHNSASGSKVSTEMATITDQTNWLVRTPRPNLHRRHILRDMISM